MACKLIVNFSFLTLLTAGNHVPWVPEVIFFARLTGETEIRGGAASARRLGSLSQSREKNNLWHPG